MNKKTVFLRSALVWLVSLLVHFESYSQVPSSNSVFTKQWSKDITLSMTKLYLVQNVVSVSNSEERLIVEGLSAATSGELTAVCYSGDSAKTVGIVLAFYGNYWNDQGVTYKGYAFKNMGETQAVNFLKKIIEVSDKNSSFMEGSMDNNNVVFKFDDMTLILYVNGPAKLRLIWKDFDAEWSVYEARKTLKKFESFIKN